MSIRASVALILLLFYATVLSFSTTLYWVMTLPLMVEIWRNLKIIRKILINFLFLNIFLIILSLSIWLMGEKHLATLIFFRSNFTILFALLLFSDKNTFDIALGLQELKLPHKLNSLFFFVAKFIYLIKQNLIQFKNTLHVRGFMPKTSLFTYRVYANFIGMLFISAVKDAQSLQNLMITRGFKGQLFSLQKTHHISKYEISLSILVIISLVFQQGVLL